MGAELPPALDREMPTAGDHRLNAVTGQIRFPLREIVCRPNDVRLTSPISRTPHIHSYDCSLDALPAVNPRLDLPFFGIAHRAAGQDWHCRLSGAADLRGASQERLANLLETVVWHYFRHIHLDISVVAQSYIYAPNRQFSLFGSTRMRPRAC